MIRNKLTRITAVLVSTWVIMFLLLPFCNCKTVLAWQSAYDKFNTNYTLTGDGATDMIAIARAQIGRTGASFNYGDEWCAIFVSDCARLAGQSEAIPLNAGCYAMQTAVKNAGGYTVSSSNVMPGDLIFFSSSKYPNGGAHVEIVVSGSGNSIVSIGGNTGSGSSWSKRSVCNPRVRGSFYCIIRPNYKNSNIVTDEPIAPYPRPSGSPYVEKGSKGLYVKWVQYTLSVQLGYDIGSAGVDGDFGTSTDSAVKAFQRDNGLEVDGQVGSETINKIVEKVHEKLNPPDPTPSGPIMSTGAGKTLPDGDYYIFSHLNPNYYLDIDGSALPAEKGTNVSMWTASTGTLPPECDVWTLKYLDNGFYKIMQKGTNLCLDVKGGSQLRGTNVQVWTEHSDTPEQWSISATDTGYKIQARCGSYCLDVSGGKITSGTNVQVWESNDSNAQRFGFIPYGASIGQTIEDGIYTIQSAANNDYCLDVQGRDSTVYQKETNVQLWNVDDCNDTFRVEYLGDGYYSICESVSGLALDIVDKGAGGYLNKNNNIQVFTNNKTRNQKWIIRDAGDGYYNIISAYSGYSIDLDGGVAEQRRNIRQHYYNTSNAQKWKFVAPIESPKESILSLDKNSALVGETITFTAESDTATGYTIGIDKDGERVTTQTMTNGKLSLAFDEAGDYSAYVTSYNVMGGLDSERIVFTIDPYELTLYETEKHTIIITGSDLTYKSSNKNVAVVSTSGVITAMGKGAAIITVTDSDGKQTLILVQVLDERIMGDCDGNGEFNISDVVIFQKWLLAVPDVELKQWKNADFVDDGKLDVFDLVLMKRELINQTV